MGVSSEWIDISLTISHIDSQCVDLYHQGYHEKLVLLTASRLHRNRVCVATYFLFCREDHEASSFLTQKKELSSDISSEITSDSMRPCTWLCTEHTHEYLGRRRY